MRSSDGSRDEENIADSAGSENEMFFSVSRHFRTLWDDSIMAGLLTTGLPLMSPSAAEIKRDREKGNKTNI